MDELARRRILSNKKFSDLKESLHASESLIAGKACVYATGSYGRQEASVHSDLDLFIVGLNHGTKKTSRGIEESLLRELDAIGLKADLIEKTKASGIREFDGDGKYLSHFSVGKLAKTLGMPEDDAENTFTARLLLLLESSPLLGSVVYDEVIEEILAAYWRDYEDHKSEFVPAFLANDILRLWRTFCINYEARTLRSPEGKKAEGKLKNYKLKHGRILTCYSALLYLLAIYRRSGTVSPSDAKNMVTMSPTMRLDWLLEAEDMKASHSAIRLLCEKYNEFLLKTDFDEAEMIEKFKDKEVSNSYLQDSQRFGELMFEALNSVGDSSRLHRLIVV